jgi:hypothetical protein
MIMRIIYGLAVPAVVTAAVPTTDDTAITVVVSTVSIALPCIHVVAVVDPEIVLGSIAKVAEVAPV